MTRSRASSAGVRLPLVPWLFAAALAASCAEESAAARGGDEPAAAADAARVTRAIADDPAREALAEVDAAIDDDLPARAAELLEQAAIPAARDAVARARALETLTDEGARLRLALVSALEARAEALEKEAAALSRGMVEDLALVDALRAERRAEERMVAVSESARKIEAADPPTR